MYDRAGVAIRRFTERLSEWTTAVVVLNSPVEW